MDRKRKRTDDIFDDASCDIDAEVDKLNFVCSIHNFSQRPEKTGERITTPTFVAGSKSVSSEWCLWVYPDGDEEESKGYMSIFLFLKKPSKAKAKFKFSILNDKKEEKIARGGRNFCEFYANDENYCWGFSKFILRNLLLCQSFDLLINDTLTILCQMEIIDLIPEKHDNEETPANVITPQSKLSSDYGNLFDSQLFTDCIVKIGDTEIKVHRTVLAARSSTFCNIFNSALENSQMNVIEIKNFRVEVVQKMLEYMYKDEISNMQDMASEILAIADEYGLDGLKEIAVKYLCGDLAIANVCECFILSEKFSNKELKECCQKFVINNAKELMETNNWKDFVSNHPLLIESIFLKSLNIPSASK